MAVAVAQSLYHTENHQENLLCGLNRERFETDSFCDATLQVHDKQFHIHKCVVGKLSSFFRKLFKVQMRETYDSFANMEGLTSEILEMFLNYVYTGSVQLNEENVFDLLAASEYLLVEGLKTCCGDYLASNINPENCIKYCLAGKKFNLSLLRRKAEEAFIKNYSSVVEHEDFVALDKEDLLHFLSRFDQDSLSFNVKDLFEGVLKWLKHDVEQRKRLLPEILRWVKLQHLSDEFLETAMDDDFIKETLEVLDALKEEVSWRVHCSSVKGTSKINSFVLIQSDSCSLFNIFNEAMKQLPSPGNATYSAVVVYQDYLYIFGLVWDPLLIRRLNLKDKKAAWEDAGQTLQERKFASAVVAGDLIIISGGNCGNSVETYRKLGEEVQQKEIEPMRYSRRMHSMVNCNDSIYCFGGARATPTEKYDNDAWKVVDADERFKRCSAVAVDKRIYVLDETRQLKVFNAQGNSWRYPIKCPITYETSSISHMEGKLYTFGLTSLPKGRYNFTLAEYDIARDAWETVFSQYAFNTASLTLTAV